jgi:hypothetical protein
MAVNQTCEVEKTSFGHGMEGGGRAGWLTGADGLSPGQRRTFIQIPQLLHTCFITPLYSRKVAYLTVRRNVLMSKARSISWQTRKNWLIDFAVFGGGLLSILSGIYFLYLPSGGYQGGRNPTYNITVLFTRHTWSDIHTWGGLLMIVAVAIHVAIHWQWVTMMARRMVGVLRRRGTRFSRGAKINLIVDVVIALAFLVTAVSGIYFLFVPGGHQAAPSIASGSDILFTRLTWDLVHTWAGVTMTVAAMLHFAIHWRWVVKVTQRFFQLPVKARRAALQS